LEGAVEGRRRDERITESLYKDCWPEAREGLLLRRSAFPKLDRPQRVGSVNSPSREEALRSTDVFIALAGNALRRQYLKAATRVAVSSSALRRQCDRDREFRVRPSPTGHAAFSSTRRSGVACSRSAVARVTLHLAETRWLATGKLRSGQRAGVCGRFVARPERWARTRPQRQPRARPTQPCQLTQIPPAGGDRRCPLNWS
jgi:hypothetical protein